MSSDAVKSLKNLSQDELQNYLCELWRKQLKLDRVDVSDDFMKLGGQSVDMFRMLAKLENDFDKEIDFDDFFETPTLAVLRDLLLRLPV